MSQVKKSRNVIRGDYIFFLQILLKGTVSQDFLTLFFLSSCTPRFSDSWAKAVSNIASYSRSCLTTKIDSAQGYIARFCCWIIANFQFYCTAMA
jgi:hypothetical protein